ncbi:MAG: hypothetical protein IJK58_03460, partial [Clostridia bacterium]|nr:hypothetical protein [Clostridia bacterium]
MKNLFNKISAILLAAILILPFVPFRSYASAGASLFSIEPEDNPGLSFSVVSYEKTKNESYMFLPNTVDPTAVTVRYSGDAGEATGSGVIGRNEEEGHFTVDTTVGNEITVGGRKLIFMQSALPAMSIIINEGESIDTINASKEAKIGAKVSISGADNAKYDLSPTDIQIK